MYPGMLSITPLARCNHPSQLCYMKKQLQFLSGAPES